MAQAFAMHIIVLFCAQKRYGCLACSSSISLCKNNGWRHWCFSLHGNIPSLPRQEQLHIEADKTQKHTDCKLFSHMNSNRIWAANSNCLHIAKITNSQALSKMIKMCFLSRKPEYKSNCGRKSNLLHNIITQATSIKLTTELQTEMCALIWYNIKFNPCKTKTTRSGRPIHETITTNSKCGLAKSIGSLRVMCAWRAGDLYGTDTFLI